MGSPLIPILCFLVVAWGFVLMMQGTSRRDLSEHGFMEAQQHFDGSYAGMRHPPERHPWRLVGIGGTMVVAGVALAVLWGALWG